MGIQRYFWAACATIGYLREAWAQYLREDVWGGEFIRSKWKSFTSRSILAIPSQGNGFPLLLKSMYPHTHKVTLHQDMDWGRDVRWPKFVGMGTERKEFLFKKDLSLSKIFSFFSFLEWVFPLFPIFLWISNPVFCRSFPIFSSFHLSKPVPYFFNGLKFGHCSD